MNEKPGVPTKEQILAELSAYSRNPFMEVLAEFLSEAPTPEAIKSFANAHPDKWASAIKQIGVIAGYTEKIEYQGNILVEVRGLSDSQLEARLHELERADKSLLIEQPAEGIGEDEGKKEEEPVKRA